jgi:hypothetical protein
VGHPEEIDPEKRYGLIVYISSSDTPTIPKDWHQILVDNDLLLIAPFQVENTTI